MKDILIFGAGAIGIYLLYKYLKDKNALPQIIPASTTSTTVGSNADSLPPLSKSKMTIDLSVQPDNSVNKPYDKFDINVVDPKFGNHFFNYGQTAY